MSVEDIVRELIALKERMKSIEDATAASFANHRDQQGARMAQVEALHHQTHETIADLQARLAQFERKPNG